MMVMWLLFCLTSCNLSIPAVLHLLYSRNINHCIVSYWGVCLFLYWRFVSTLVRSDLIFSMKSWFTEDVNNLIFWNVLFRFFHYSIDLAFHRLGYCHWLTWGYSYILFWFHSLYYIIRIKHIFNIPVYYCNSHNIFLSLKIATCTSNEYINKNIHLY